MVLATGGIDRLMYSPAKRGCNVNYQMDLSCRKASRLLVRAGGQRRSFTSQATSLYLNQQAGRQAIGRQ